MTIAIYGRRPTPEPQQPYQLNEREIEYIRAIQTEDDRRAAKQAAQAQVDAEYANSIEGQTEQFRTGEPPDDLRVNLRGLTPARARYMRHVAWIDAQRAEITRLEHARDRLLTTLGAPQVHQAELDALVQGDRSGFAAWVISGANGVKPTIETFRRSKIQQELEKATAEAEAARAGMTAVDDALAVATKAVEILESRRPGLARAALREAAAGRMAIYAKQVEQLQATIGDLAGLQLALDGAWAGPPREVHVPLPYLVGDGPAPRVTVTAGEVERAARPWREALKRLLADPHTEIN